MWCYHRSQVERQPGWFVGFLFTNNTFSCLAEQGELLAVMESAQLFSSAPRRGEALFPFPHPLVLSACVSSQIIHSRAKSQSLSLSFSECLYGSVDLPTPPLYYSPLLSSPLCFSLSWGGGSWYLWCLQRTVSQPIGVHESCDCIREIEIWIEKAIEPDRECKKRA